MQVLLHWVYFVLICLVMLWFFFPTLHAWMTNAGWLDAP